MIIEKICCSFSHYNKQSPRRGVKDLTRASVKKICLHSMDACNRWRNTMTGMRKENSQKNRSNWYHVISNCVAWLVKNSKTLFSKLTQKISYKVSRRASKWIFPPPERYFSFFWVVNSMIYVVFILGKCSLDSYQSFLYLLKFGSTTFVYHHMTFRRHVSFSISLQLVSVKNKLL